MQRQVRLSLSVRQALAAALACALALPTQAQDVTLTLDEARAVATAALAQGDPVLAGILARGLLQADPDDSDALVLMSVVAGLAGNGRAALAFGRRAWRVADTPTERFEAATVTARALTAEGALTRARFWLRRSTEAAPTPEARALAEANFLAVRAEDRLSLRFNLTATPSSNVNAGSSSRFVTLFGLPFVLGDEQRALSGTSAVAEVSVAYRLPRTVPQASTQLTFSAVERGVVLSAEARRQAPDARNADYGYTAVEFGVRHRIVPRGVPHAFTLDVVTGRNWSGGEPLSNYQRVEGAIETAAGPDGFLRMALTLEHQARLDDRRRSADIAELQADLIRETPTGDRLSTRATLRRTWSDGFDIGNVAVSGRLGWDRAEPIAGIGIGAGVSAGWQAFDLSPLAPDGDRRDRTLGVDLTLTLTQVEYLGFSPTLNLSASRTRSTFALYDREDVGLSLGFRSSF